MERIYYDSKTGNVDRFVKKLQQQTDWEIIKITPDEAINEEGHLITFTTRFGEIPISTQEFLKQAVPYLKSVSSSGNRNWGSNYGVAADRISAEYGLPMGIKFELSGTQDDVVAFIKYIENKHDDKKRNSEELDTA